jgi:hypothetical protein
MLDEMRVLRAAIQRYRTAAMALGVAWPERGDTEGAQPLDLDLIHRVFDIDRLPEQLSWFRFDGWDPRWPCPVDGELEPWPTDAATTRESLSVLCFAIGTPFPWRRQIPLFRFDPYVYTFVLAGDHEGEIWRYLISPDLYDPVRAAPSLAALFDAWTDGIAAGVVYRRESDDWLMVGEPTETARPFDVLRERAPHLDFLAFPIDIPASALRERQREFGVDLDCIDRGPECQAAQQDAVDAVCASLGV